MADVAVATTDAFSTKLTSAAVDDTMVMASGLHLTPSSGAGRQSVNKRVKVRPAGWSSPSMDGRWVSSGDGHDLSDWPSQWRGGWTFSTAAVEARGMLFNGRMQNGAGSVDMRANSLRFYDCGFTDEFFGYIMCHAEALPSDIQFHRCRFFNIGKRSGHDHPIYWKDVTAALGRCTVFDSIFYNCTGWAMHAYYNGDQVLYKRCLVYRCNGAGVFSAEGANATSGAGFEECLLLDAQGYDLGATTEVSVSPDYLVETNGAGTGYVTNSMAVNNDPGGGVLGAIEGTVTQTNNRLTGVPLWLNGPPEVTGDFRLDPNPANPALGYGPDQIQPSASGPIDTVGGQTALAVHRTSAAGLDSSRSNLSLAVHTNAAGGTSVEFANDPDRVTPGP